MKSFMQSTAIIFIATFGSLACADTGTKLSLSIELKEGETVVSKPRLIVLNGRHAGIEVGAVPVAGGTSSPNPLGWKIDILPTMANAEEVQTKFDIRVTSASSEGLASTRSMSVETRQSLGKTISIQIPGADGQQPLSLSLRTDLAAQ